MALDFVRAELQRIHRQGLHRRLRDLEGPPAPRVRWQGRDMLQLASNSYLGLATHPEIVHAARDALAAWGTGAGGARLLSGSTTLHRELEGALARLKGTEDAVLFSTGYQANVGTVAALGGPQDLLLSDELNHASLIDACRLSRATVRVFAHRDVEDAQRILRAERRDFGRCLILTDGVFSMDGDLAPLEPLAELASAHDAALMVDDAHGTGVLGPTGAGSVEHQGVTKRVDIQMGTLSKALASQGGFIAGSQELCDLLRNRARSFLFSTAPPAASVAASLAALRIVAGEPQRRERLASNAQRLRRGLQELGFDVPDGRTPIVPVRIGAAEPALALARALEEQGIFLPAVRPPTVPAGSCRLRATVMATHTREDLDGALASFERLRPQEVRTSAPASS